MHLSKFIEVNSMPRFIGMLFEIADDKNYFEFSFWIFGIVVYCPCIFKSKFKTTVGHSLFEVYFVKTYGFYVDESKASVMYGLQSMNRNYLRLSKNMVMRKEKTFFFKSS